MITIHNFSDKRRAFRHAGGLAAIGPGESRDLEGLVLSAKARDALEAEGWEFVGGYDGFDSAYKPAPAETLDALKARADEMGISYAPNIGEATLAARIEAAEAAQEPAESEAEGE